MISIISPHKPDNDERRVKCQKKFKILLLLARNLRSNLYADLIDFIKNLVFSEQFVERHKKSPQDFTRERKLPFHSLVFLLMNLMKGSYQDELDNFFKVVNGIETFERIVSKPALTTAREKLKHEAFIELNAQAHNYFYEHFAPRTWLGFNLLAIDGSTVRLPKNDEIVEHFGAWNPEKGQSCPIARISQMYDVLNKITVDAIISPKSVGERNLAAWHFLQLMPEDLLLLDRGYPAFWFFKLILSQGANFCARVPYNNWNVTKKFYKSGKTEDIVKIDPSHVSKKACAELGLDRKPLKVRLVRVELDNVTTEILITSLKNKDKYQAEIFHELYHKRWPVEEDYKAMKCRVQIENFSGKSVHSIYQDFHAKVFSKNLTAILTYSVKDIVEERCQDCQYQYQVNFTHALSKMKDTIVLLFNRPVNLVFEIIVRLRKILSETIEPIRLGRKFPRIHKIQRKDFNFCYKQIR
jgi:hypothetical protein